MFMLFWAAVATAQHRSEQPENQVLDARIMLGQYEMTVELDPQGRKLIRLEGDVGHLFGYNLTNLLQLNDDVEYIELFSTGGKLFEIREPGIYIRERSLPVHVRKGEYCISACAYLALFSQDIKVDGQLAFHMPYAEEFSRELTLYDVSQSTVVTTLLLTHDLFANGWALVFYLAIASVTDINNYMVFESGDELEKFRVNDVNRFIDDDLQMPSWIIRNSEQMSARATEQMLD